MGGLGNVLRKGVGLGALVLALASPAYSAGPAKKAATPYPTPAAIETTKDLSIYSGMMGAYPQLANAHHVNTHKSGKDMWLVFMSNKDKILGVYDLEAGELMNKKEITATPIPARPTLTPTPVPTKDELLSLDTYTSTPVRTSTKTPAPAADKTQTPAPTSVPKISSKIHVPIIVGGNASVGYSTEKITGTIYDGTKWAETHSGLVVRVKDATVRTSENYGKALFHGGLLIDGSYLSGSIKGLEAGKFKDIEAFGRLFAGAGRKFSDSLTMLGQVGAGYAIKSDRFQYAGGTFSKASHTSLRPPGLEFRVLALTPSVNLGLRGKHLVYSAAQDGYNSKDIEDQFAIVAEIPKIDTSKGPLRANLEAGLRSTNSAGLSNQGDWKQSIAYLLVELGKDVKGIPVFGYFGLDTLAKQPDVGFSLGSTRYMAGLGINPSYRLSGQKK